MKNRAVKRLSKWRSVVPAAAFVAQTATAGAAWVPGRPAAEELVPVPPPTVQSMSAQSISGQYMSTVQLAVQESTPKLMQRSQKLVRDQFVSIFDSWPEFRGQRYEVRTVGNQLVFSLITENDIRVPMERVIATAIQQLNGRVQARGRTMFYKADANPAMGGYLEVALDDSHTKIKSISAQSVSLRDLLKEIRFQKGSVSYLIPGDCARKQVDWSFAEAPGAGGKNIDVVMGELATLFDLKLEKKNGTYIFSGPCHEARYVGRGNRAMQPSPEAPTGAGFMVPVSAESGHAIPHPQLRPQVLLTLPPLE